MQELHDEIYLNVEKHYRENNLEKYLQALLFKYDIKDICKAVLGEKEWTYGAMKEFCDLAKQYDTNIFKNHNKNSYLVLERNNDYYLLQKIGVDSPEQFILAYNLQCLDDGTWEWDRGSYFDVYESSYNAYIEKSKNSFYQKEAQVISKLEKELEEFKAEMVTKSPDELYSCAYEISTVEDFYYLLTGDHDFDEQELDVLLRDQTKILATLYGDWMDSDFNSCDDMREVYTEFIYELEHTEPEIGSNIEEDYEL
jgi:hypothetical protein